MINHFLLLCSILLIYEFFKYLNFFEILKSNLKIYHKIIRLFRYKYVPDFRKQKLLFVYSKLLLKISLKILLILILILIFILCLNLISKSFIDLLISVIGFIEVSTIVIIYHKIRKKFNAEL